MIQRDRAAGRETSSLDDALAILMAQTRAVEVDLQQSVNDVMQVFMDIHAATDAQATGSSTALTGLISQAIVRLQFGDRLSQRLEHIRRGMELIMAEVSAHEQVAFEDVSAVQRLLQLYTSEDEASLHRKTLAERYGDANPYPER